MGTKIMKVNEKCTRQNCSEVLKNPNKYLCESCKKEFMEHLKASGAHKGTLEEFIDARNEFISTPKSSKITLDEFLNNHT